MTSRLKLVDDVVTSAKLKADYISTKATGAHHV